MAGISILQTTRPPKAVAHRRPEVSERPDGGLFFHNILAWQKLDVANSPCEMNCLFCNITLDFRLLSLLSSLLHHLQTLSQIPSAHNAMHQSDDCSIMLS